MRCGRRSVLSFYVCDRLSLDLQQQLTKIYCCTLLAAQAQRDFDHGPKPFHLGPERFYGHGGDAARREHEGNGGRLRDEIVLAMDVDLGLGKTGRIGIRRGDRPVELARDFAQVYRLDATAEGRLVRIIESQMRQKQIAIGSL